MYWLFPLFLKSISSFPDESLGGGSCRSRERERERERGPAIQLFFRCSRIPLSFSVSWMEVQSVDDDDVRRADHIKWNKETKQTFIDSPPKIWEIRISTGLDLTLFPSSTSWFRSEVTTLSILPLLYRPLTLSPFFSPYAILSRNQFFLLSTSSGARESRE